MVKIRVGKNFNQDYQNLLEEDKSLGIFVFERVKIFRNNPQDTRIKNHALTKRLKGKWAFSITSDIRVIYEWTGKNTVRFLAIGGHPQVYKK